MARAGGVRSRGAGGSIVKGFKLVAATLVAVLAISSGFFAEARTTQWEPGTSAQWYARQPWLVGANYLPASAINQLEMWQAATFDPVRIDRELTAAEAIGMNTMRVFLHDLAWQEDPAGFTARLSFFLTLASRHHIRPMLVLFDSCWDPRPHVGPQHPPIPGVHNSGWVQSPGWPALSDPLQVPRLEAYVRSVIGIFANDPRVLAWDLWNEPDNLNGSSYQDPPQKLSFVEQLLPQVFAWARSANPSQPLTSAVWTGDWSSPGSFRAIEKIQVSLSDVVTFHNYESAPQFQSRVQQLARFGRPVICTEYMARPLGSTFATILPLAKRDRVGAINWGFFAGKSQTYFPWSSWQAPNPAPPSPWFHDIFRPDGTPYDGAETALIRELTR